MRLLQVSLRSLLVYSLVVVLISIPLSLYFIDYILKEEVDESLQAQTEQFVKHIKSFEFLEDLEIDLAVLDKLSYNMSIQLAGENYRKQAEYATIDIYDSLEKEYHPFRQLSTQMSIKDTPYLLTVQISLVDTNDLVLAIGTIQTILIILLVTGLWFINRSLSKKLWKPFYETLDQLKAYQIDRDELFDFNETNIIEFEDLNATVRNLTDRNRNVYLQQKEFIENAAHELQTPIAVFQSKLDNLMQSAALQAADALTLAELEETAKRMARLNKNLLLLSKIDNDQFKNKEYVDVARVIVELLKNVQHVADAENIVIKTQLDSLEVKANKTLMEILLTNLIHNAIRHNHPNGKVFIKLAGEKLEISNTGDPLKMDADKIFDRFSKESPTQNSIGLGLAIAKKICMVSNYEIQYQYNQEHMITVNFNIV